MILTDCRNCDHSCQDPAGGLKCLASPITMVVDENRRGHDWVTYEPGERVNDGMCWKYWSASVPVEFGIVKRAMRWLWLRSVRRDVQKARLTHANY